MLPGEGAQAFEKICKRFGCQGSEYPQRAEMAVEACEGSADANGPMGQ